MYLISYKSCDKLAFFWAEKSLHNPKHIIKMSFSRMNDSTYQQYLDLLCEEVLVIYEKYTYHKIMTLVI